MKIQLAILLIFALFICNVISAESEKTSKLIGKKMGRHNNKIRQPDDAQKGERRSRFPRRLNHGNGGYRTTSRMLMKFPGSPLGGK
ncbi:unnamed protein product [Caenorhabditis nigoni]